MKAMRSPLRRAHRGRQLQCAQGVVAAPTERSYPLTKFLLLRKLGAARGTPLVVFAMSKTASTAIFKALAAYGQKPLLRTHMLSPDSLARAEENYRETAPDARPRHLFHGFYLSRHLPTAAAPWLIVTMVRDPIARAASEFFQGAERFGRMSDHAKIAESYERFVRESAIPRAVNWFDREFEPAVGVDVCAHPFDHVQGYNIIDVPQARILVLRQESLHVAPVALARFLGVSGRIQVAAENVGSEKRYKELYERLLGEVRFSAETLDAAYCSRVVRHFYGPEEIEQFRRRWKSATRCTPRCGTSSLVPFSAVGFVLCFSGGVCIRRGRGATASRRRSWCRYRRSGATR